VPPIILGCRRCCQRARQLRDSRYRIPADSAVFSGNVGIYGHSRLSRLVDGKTA
jgi:hypothetical protein